MSMRRPCGHSRAWLVLSCFPRAPQFDWDNHSLLVRSVDEARGRGVVSKAPRRHPQSRWRSKPCSMGCSSSRKQPLSAQIQPLRCRHQRIEHFDKLSSQLPTRDQIDEAAYLSPKKTYSFPIRSLIRLTLRASTGACPIPMAIRANSICQKL